MAQITRSLTFLTNDLGRDTTLVLTFDDVKNLGEYKSVFAVVWKVGSFKASGQSTFAVTFKSEFGFICGLTAPNAVVYAYTDINPGEKTTLTEGGNPVAHSFSAPIPTQMTAKMVAENDARDKVDMVFGVFDRSDRPPAQTIFFEGVERRSSVQVEQPDPTLLGYISSDYIYKEGEVLRSAIPFPVIFNQKLAELEPETFWRIEFTQGTSECKITRSR